jgi:type II secretory pathway pseudopilin PulG
VWSDESGAPTPAPRFFCAGWTFVELVIVLAVAAVLAVVAVRSLRPAEALALQQAERLRDDLRHAQILAMTLGAPLQLKLGAPAACPGASYYVIRCTVAGTDPCTGAPDTPIADPRLAGGLFCVTLESPLALAGANLYFDPLGRPKSGTALIAANHVFQLTGGSVLRTAIVTPLTGFTTAQ